MKKQQFKAASELHNREVTLARQQRALEADSLRTARRVAELTSIARATGRVLLGGDLLVDWNATK